MAPGGNRSNKTHSESSQSNSWKSIHSHFYLRLFFFFSFIETNRITHKRTHQPVQIWEQYSHWILGCFRITFWKTLGLILFWRASALSPIDLLFLCPVSSQDAPDLWVRQQRVRGPSHGQRASDPRELSGQEKEFQARRALQLGQTQVNLWFRQRRTKPKRCRRGCSHPRPHAHSPDPGIAHACCQAWPCLLFPPLERQSFCFWRNWFWILKFKPFHRAPANEQTKWY